MEKEVKYTRTFYDISENEQQIEKWLKKHGGVEGEDYRVEFRGMYYIANGWEQTDVLAVGDLVVEIFNPSVAYQFELFKVGGRCRDRTQSTLVDWDSDYEYMTDHACDDKPVYLDKS